MATRENGQSLNWEQAFPSCRASWEQYQQAFHPYAAIVLEMHCRRPLVARHNLYALCAGHQ